VKRDTESPYRKVVVTTDLKSDSRLSNTLHLSFSQLNFNLVGNLGTGGRRGTSKGGPNPPGLFDWDIASAAKPHIPSNELEASLQNGSITNLISGGRTLGCKSHTYTPVTHPFSQIFELIFMFSEIGLLWCA
jgi:hypothetical protein